MHGSSREFSPGNSLCGFLCLFGLHVLCHNYLQCQSNGSCVLTYYFSLCRIYMYPAHGCLVVARCILYAAHPRVKRRLQRVQVYCSTCRVLHYRLFHYSHFDCLSATSIKDVFLSVFPLSYLRFLATTIAAIMQFYGVITVTAALSVSFVNAQNISQSLAILNGLPPCTVCHGIFSISTTIFQPT